MIDWFTKKSVGIDIADHRIWVTRLAKTGGVSVVDKLCGAKLEPGVVVDGRIKDKKALAASINKLMDDAKGESSCKKRIVFGLPKNQAYVHVFSDESGKTNKDYLKQAVKKDTEESIPLDANDLYYTYKILSKTAEKTKILVIAVSKKVIREWQDFFASIGVEVKVYDLGSLATFRNLYKKPPKKPLCMIDMGGDATSITIFNSKGLRYSHAIKVAGIEVTSRIAKDLDISQEEAEKLKIKGNLGENSKILASVKAAMKPIFTTTKEIIDYIKVETEEDVEKIVLVGGASLIKGLPDLFKEETGVEAELGKPIITKGKAGFEHLNSIGLALRGIEGRTKQKDPGLSPLKKQKKSKIEQVAKRVILSDQENETGAEAMSLDDMEEAKKLKKQKRILLVILFIGLILIAASLWYRNNEAQKKQLENPGEMSLFSNIENLTLQIPVATHKDEYTSDRVKGRITESIENDLKTGEKIWLDPVALNPSRWLIYSETEAQAFLLAKIKNDIMADFSLNNIVYKMVINTDNRNIFYLKADVSIYTAEPLKIEKEKAVEETMPSKEELPPIEELEPEEAPVVEEQKSIMVKETPLGWLNVREGPSTSYEKVGQINSGEEYFVLSESDNWTEIDLGEGISGWVFDDYIEIIIK